LEFQRAAHSSTAPHPCPNFAEFYPGKYFVNIETSQTPPKKELNQQQFLLAATIPHASNITSIREGRWPAARRHSSRPSMAARDCEALSGNCPSTSKPNPQASLIA